MQRQEKLINIRIGMNMSKNKLKKDKSRSGNIEIYDTTLRDGSQLEGISLTVNDKLRIASQLDYLGVTYIEGGWPGSNPKDSEFFARAKEELELETSQLVAFGSTRRPNGTTEDLEPLISAKTDVVCIVGKAWDYHVTDALRISLEEGIAMVVDSIRYLKDQGKKTFWCAEHLFDGYKANPDFTLEILSAAVDAGVDCLVLCDTNGGSLPHQVGSTTESVLANVPGARVGVHLHNDTDCGVGSALAGVMAGATHVQGTMNGYGERTGNSNLISVIANLELKMGIQVLPKNNLKRMSTVARHVAELVNFAPNPHQPYVGVSAFAHKAGLHTSALVRRSDAYEHINPQEVGNTTRYVMSEMSGRASVEIKAKELGIELDSSTMSEIVETLKRLEYEGYHFEVADASLELLMLGASGWEQPFFRTDSFSVGVKHRQGDAARIWNEVSVEMETEAEVKLMVKGEEVSAKESGNGPINALHAALGSVLSPHFPEFKKMQLIDYKVRVLDTAAAATKAITRVLIETTDGERVWNTIGVSENIVEASWQALVDSIVWGLLHSKDK